MRHVGWILTGTIGCAEPAPTPKANEEGALLPGEGQVDTALARALQTTLDDAAQGIGAPGAAAAVVLPDGTSWVGVTGVASVETGEPVTDDLAFRIGSITKSYIMIALLQLADEGVVSLEDPIEAWYPQVPNAGQVSLRQLLNHTSGLKSYTEITEFYRALAADEAVDPGIDTIIDWSADDGPRFPPGAQYEYSNTGYHVLGRVLEIEEDAPLQEILDARIFRPLSLGRTWIEGAGEPHEPTSLAQGHLNGELDRSLSPDWRWAAGGMAATVRDNARWALHLLVDGDVVPQDLRDDLYEVTPASVDAGEPYALALRERNPPCGPGWGHTGSTMGFNSDMFHTEDGVTIIVHTNDFFTNASDIAYPLCDTASRGEDPEPLTRP